MLGRCVANPDKPGYFIHADPDLCSDCLAAATTLRFATGRYAEGMWSMAR
ncbi:hypothetical protein [Pseudomonas syringae]